jgi:hypothetical protein
MSLGTTQTRTVLSQERMSGGIDPVSATVGGIDGILGSVTQLIQGGRDKKMQEAQLAGAASANQLNAILSLSQQKQAQEANRQRNNLIIGVVVLLVAAVSAFFIIRTNKRKNG